MLRLGNVMFVENARTYFTELVSMVKKYMPKLTVPFFKEQLKKIHQ